MNWRLTIIMFTLWSAGIARGQTVSILLTPSRVAGYTILNDPNQGTIQYTATCIDAAGVKTDCTSTVTWNTYRRIPLSATMSAPGVFTGVSYGFLNVWATLPTPDVSITGYVCTTTTSCTFTTSTPPTVVVGSFYYVKGLTATGGTVTGGTATPPDPDYTFPQFDGRVFAITAVNNTTAPYSFTATTPKSGGALCIQCPPVNTPKTDTGTATISSQGNFGVGGKTLVGTFNPTPLNSTNPMGAPALPQLPHGITSNNTWPPSYSGTVYDTTFSVPVGGTTRTPACTGGVGNVYGPTDTTSLEYAMLNYSPGDVILLNHLCTWTMNSFKGMYLQAKANPSHLYTYIMSDAYQSLPPPGPGTGGVNPASRINPAVDGPNMPLLITTIQGGATSAIFTICGIKLVSDFTGCQVNTSIPGGYVRFVGLHMASRITGYANPLGATLIEINEQRTGPVPTITNVIYDRLWIDGGPRVGQPGAQGLMHGVNLAASPSAFIDSFCNNIWAKGFDAQCAYTIYGNGPIKVNNNWIEGYGEGIEIGGGGGALVQWLPSDIENINNHSFHSPEMIISCVAALGGGASTCKNLWEYKFGQRVLIDHNTFEGQINAGQQLALALTTRTNQSGLNARDNDFTITNNYWKDVSGGPATVAWNGPSGGDPVGMGEINGGENIRNAFINNVLTACEVGNVSVGCNKGMYMWGLAPGLQAWTIEHNTTTMQPPFVNNNLMLGTNYNGQVFLGIQAIQPPQYHNIWKRCNVELRPDNLAGAGGGFVASGLNAANINTVMGDPAGNMPTRWASNIYYGIAGDPTAPNYPPGNVVIPYPGLPSFIAPSPAVPQNYQLAPAYLASLSPAPAACYDGHPIGVNGVVGEVVPPNTRFTISGTLTGATGVTFTMTGFNRQILPNVSGSYSFPDLMNGTYTVTPYLFGYDFTPPSATITISQANATQNFTAVAGAQYTISGNISGSVSSGVAVTLAGPQNLAATTDAGGNYSFTVFNGTYTITPSSPGNSFTPSPPVTVVVSGATPAAVNFTSVAIPVYAVSGNITNNGAPQSGVSVAITGAASTTIATDASGNYSVLLPNGVYTITPTLSQFTFTPARYNITVASAAIPNQNFTSIQTGGPTVSGNTVIPASVTVFSSTAQVATKTSDSAGNFSIPGVPNGTYILRAQGGGVVCAPEAVPFVMAGANVVQNFNCVAGNPININGAITGAVSNGVFISVTGSNTGAAFSGVPTSGVYNVNGFAAGGTYTITPSLSGYIFAPSSITITPSATSNGNNFVATAVAPTFHIISGMISGDTQAGVTLNLSGAGTASTVSDGSGNYSFPNLANGLYIITPSLSGFTFSPPSLTVSLSSVDVINQNFSANLNIGQTYTISGTVTGTVTSGVTMSLAGAASATTTTDASGNYAFSNLGSGAYTLTPSLTGYIFAPFSTNLTILSASLTQNFTSSVSVPPSATPATLSVGHIGPSLGRAAPQKAPKKQPKKEQPK